MSLDDDARAELAALGAAGRLRVPRVVDGAQGPTMVIDGREVVCMASNDYLGLAADPRIARAGAAALERDGAGAGASRLITGTMREHVALEEGVAEWMRAGGARLFNTGYAANTGVLPAIAGPGDRVFSDELNHASIIDGCRLSRAAVHVYPHRDVAALERALAEGGGRRRIVVTESLFSMDGDVPDLAAIAALCAKHDAALVVDEAHAIGAHGPEGRGLCAASGVVPDVLVGTFGKALGAFGAFVATSRNIAELLYNRARSLVFSTALPPSVPAAARAAIEIVRGAEGDDRRRALAAHARLLRSLVPAIGGAPDSAIAPLMVGEDRAVMRASARLLDDGVFVQGIRPPTVPVGGARLRVSLSARHTVQHVEVAAASLLRATSE